MKDKIKALEDKIALAHLGGGENRIAKQHEKEAYRTRKSRISLRRRLIRRNRNAGNPQDAQTSEWKKNSITAMESSQATEP